MGRLRALMTVAGLGLVSGPLAMPAPAGANSASLTATLTAAAVGQRTVAAVPSAPAVTVGPGGERIVAFDFTVAVDEVSRAGTTDWTVLAQASPVKAALAPFTIADRQAARHQSAGVATVPDGADDLTRPVVLFRQTGQQSERLHTGTHTVRSRIALKLAGVAASDGYAASVPVLIVTLVQ